MKPARFRRVEEVIKKDYLALQKKMKEVDHRVPGYLMCSETLQESKFLKMHFTQRQWDESLE